MISDEYIEGGIYVLRKIVKGSVSTVLILSLVIALAACSGGNNTANNGKASNASNGGEKQAEGKAEGKTEGKTIELLTFFSSTGTSGREVAFKQIVDNFTEETGIEVKYTTVPWNEVDTQVILSEQAGNSPDVSFIRDKEFARHMQVGSIKPLDEYIAADLTEEEIQDHLNWKMGEYEGKKYVFPTSYIGTALYMRADLLKEKGLKAPKTWEEFVEVGKAINSKETVGYLFGGSPAQANQLDWLQSFIVDRGGQVLDEKGKASFDSQAGIEAFEFLKRVIHEEGITPLDAASTTYDGVTDAFAAGRAGMIIEGSHRYTVVADALGKENVQVGMIPGINAGEFSPTVISAWTLGIPKGSKHSDEAWEFIKFFTSAESSLTYAKISKEVPTRQSVVEDEFYNSPDQEITKFFVDYINKNGVVATAPQTAKELNNIIAETIQAVILDKNSDVEALVKQAAENYNKIVK